ncbi:MAG TPA: serine/threonine protein kinase, partial [Gammaproteobacteria bacterium]|nr:serine/threonine protein kinase [Gammaproteobacteria bacterium]
MALSFSPVRALLVLGLSFALAACDSGDININPATTDNTVDNSVSNSNNTTQAATPTVNPCASYENSGGTKLQGDFDGTHCTYNEIFSDGGANPILVDLVLTKLDNSGVHVFKGSLFMGKNYSTDAGLSGAGITKGGDGPTLSIEAGATIAFTSASDFIAINRGSKMNAIGTAAEPITFTSLSDINGT